ncbi:MAG: S8/S53 family peptidase [Candidatus Eremiobacteraeota bacterium]|nr:S8/S53 family peptidase [Candidatus Eremiobacteraeota bacterium]MCW5866673.1 S8/S53 family peptidase [Candidatus Eremiobacteraeota bacterium]
MLGLAVLAVGSATPAPQPQAQVMLLDEFPRDSTSLTHGTMVEAVLQSRTQVSHQRVQVPLGAQMDLINRPEPGNLDKYIVQRFSVPTEATARALENMHRPGVAAQSQGASESRVVESLWGAAQARPATRSFLENELGLASGSSDAEFLQALVHRVDEVHHGDRTIGAARQHLLRAAHSAEEAGVIRVVSAGNQGHLEQLFDRLGVLTGRDFYMSDMADPAAIIVGASDNHGTDSRADDGPAALASPNAGALVGAQGVNVPVTVHGKTYLESGSSFAQPQVSALVAEWKSADPGLTRDEALQRLLTLSQPVSNAEPYIGAGIIYGQ